MDAESQLWSNMPGTEGFLPYTGLVEAGSTSGVLGSALAPSTSHALDGVQLAQAVSAAVAAILGRPRGSTRPTTGYLRTLARALDELPRAPIEQAIITLYSARAQGRHVYVLGAGDSVSTASYFARDLSRQRFLAHQPPLRAVASSGEVELLPDPARELDSAVSGRSLEKRLRALLQRDDVVIAISTDAAAPAMAKAVRLARHQGAITIALTGAASADFATEAEQAVTVACSRAEQVKGAHLFIEYVICTALRDLDQAALPPVRTPRIASDR